MAREFLDASLFTYREIHFASTSFLSPNFFRQSRQFYGRTRTCLPLHAHGDYRSDDNAWSSISKINR